MREFKKCFETICRKYIVETLKTNENLANIRQSEDSQDKILITPEIMEEFNILPLDLTENTNEKLTHYLGNPLFDTVFE